MPNIKPVSDLRNYNTVLSEVAYGSPVYLTKNGRGDYAIISMKEVDELKAIKDLFGTLEQGEASAREKGFISLEESRRMLGV